MKITSFRLPKEVLETLRKNAKYANMSMNKLIIRLIKAHDKLLDN